MIQFVDKDYLLIIFQGFFICFLNKYIKNIYFNISLWYYLCDCFFIFNCYNAEYNERIIVKSFLNIQRLTS